MMISDGNALSFVGEGGGGGAIGSGDRSRILLNSRSMN
jgi:hypothetical protein